MCYPRGRSAPLLLSLALRRRRPEGGALCSRRLSATKANDRPSERRKMRTVSHTRQAFVMYFAFLYVAAISIYDRRFSSEKQGGSAGAPLAVQTNLETMHVLCSIPSVWLLSAHLRASDAAGSSPTPPAAWRPLPIWRWLFSAEYSGVYIYHRHPQCIRHRRNLPPTRPPSTHGKKDHTQHVYSVHEQVLYYRG